MFIPLRSRHWGALLFCGAFIACSGDGPTAGEATVSTVLISGAPATPVLVGATVQLAATPLNETGGTLSNQRVS